MAVSCLFFTLSWKLNTSHLRVCLFFIERGGPVMISFPPNPTSISFELLTRASSVNSDSSRSIHKPWSETFSSEIDLGIVNPVGKLSGKLFFAMKLKFKEINKDGSGSIGLIPDEAEDMWHAYNLISKGDSVRATTVRYNYSHTRTTGGFSQKLRLVRVPAKKCGLLWLSLWNKLILILKRDYWE